LFCGEALRLPARRGQILPLDWQPRTGVTIHYVTSEIVEVTDDGATITLRTEQDEFFAEVSLVGYRCTSPAGVDASTAPGRIRLHGKEGVLRLTRSA